MSEQDQRRAQLIAVSNSLSRVPEGTRNMVNAFATNMSESEVISKFNENAMDLFDVLLELERRMNLSYDIKGLQFMFDKAVKMNRSLPVDKFTLTILEFAAEIYSGDEEAIINMPLPDAKVSVDKSSGFSLIRSQEFKNIWVTLGANDKSRLSDIIAKLTTYANVYFVQMIRRTVNK